MPRPKTPPDVADATVAAQGPGWWGRPLPLRVLAMIQMAIGLGIALFAVFPPLPTTPRLLDAVTALVCLVLAGWTLAVVPRLAPWGLTLSVCATSVLLAALTTQMHTPQGQLAAGFGLAMLCVFAGQYLRGRHLLVMLVVTIGSYVVALLVDPVLPGALVYAFGVSLVLVGITTQVARLESRLQHQALHDPLTGALNRRGLAERAPAARDLAARSGRPTTVVMVDIDGFKSFNDTHGHAAGDDALVALVAGWRRILRTSDLVGRFGGDEFVLVLPGSSVDEAHALLARLREGSPLAWTSGQQVWPMGEDLFVRLAAADADLYRAKHVPVIDLAAGPGTVVDLGAAVPVRASAQEAVGGDGQPR